MNLTEKLNKIDHYCLDKNKEFYDLKSLYEAVKPKLSEKQKKRLEKVVSTKNPKLIEKTLRKFENNELAEDLDLADKNQLSYYYLQTVKNSLNTYGDKLSKDDIKSAMGFAVDDFDNLKNEVLYGEVSDWTQGEGEYDESLKEDWETFESKRDELLKHAHPDYTDALKNLDPYSDENYWEEVRSKQVMDSDGFWTDYTLYYNEWTEEYVAVFGDSDLYRPEDENWDAGPFDTEEEALEWFNSYNGFDDEDMDESLKKEGLREDTDMNKTKKVTVYFTEKNTRLDQRKNRSKTIEVPEKMYNTRDWDGIVKIFKEEIKPSVFKDSNITVRSIKIGNSVLQGQKGKLKESANDDEIANLRGRLIQLNKAIYYNREDPESVAWEKAKIFDRLDELGVNYYDDDYDDNFLDESTKRDFIDAYTWAYGSNKKEAQKAYKEFDPESRKELVYGFKGNAKKSFLTDSLQEDDDVDHIVLTSYDFHDDEDYDESLKEEKEFSAPKRITISNIGNLLDRDDDLMFSAVDFFWDRISSRVDEVGYRRALNKIPDKELIDFAKDFYFNTNESLKEGLWDEKLHAVIMSGERPQLAFGSNGGYKTINVRDKLDWFTTNSADEMYDELKDFYSDPYYKDCTCTVSGRGWSVDLKDFLKEYESGNKMTEKYSKKLKEGIVNFSPEDELEFEKLIEDFGWEIEDKGKTWLGSTHYQIINPSVQVFSEKSFDKAVETYIEPFVKEIDNFKKEEGSPITWSFGVNKDGYMTAGIDLHNR